MEIRTREREGITILDIQGDIVGSDPGVARLHRSVLEALAEGKKNLLLRLDEVEQIDSKGVGEILMCLKSVIEARGRLKLVLKSFTKHHFLLPDPVKIVEIFENEEAAVKSFG